MKKKKDIQIANIMVSPINKMILFFGLILVCFGILLITCMRPLCSNAFFAFRSFACVSLGAVFFYLSLVHIKKTAFFFLGLLFQLIGFLFILIDLELISYAFSQLWPVVLIFAGFCLFVTNFYKQSRILKQFLVPAVLLFCLGLVFLLFSLHLFNFTFSQFVVEWWPLFIVVMGIILVVLFFINKKKVPVE